MFVPIMLIVHYISLKRVRRNAMIFANYEAMERVFGKKMLSKNYPLLLIRVLTLIFLIFAVAGTSVLYEGIANDYDFVLAIDASASMLAKDYDPDRISAAKESAQVFVNSVSEGTNIGVLSFAGSGFVKKELSDDLNKVRDAINYIEVEMSGGTAIGEAIVSSTNVLLAGKKDKIIILLTDGQNNIGIDLESAINYANRFQVRINTIGIGTIEGGTVPNTSLTVGLDEETLMLIANETGGTYYRALNKYELRESYRNIASTSKQEIIQDLSMYLMLIALSLFIVELILVNSKYRTIP